MRSMTCTSSQRSPSTAWAVSLVPRIGSRRAHSDSGHGDQADAGQLAHGRPRGLAGQDPAGVRGGAPGHRRRVRADQHQRLQRGHPVADRRRRRSGPDHLPPVRREPRVDRDGLLREPRPARRRSPTSTPTRWTPWTGADGATYCVPVAAVLAGFFYNKDIFDELGLRSPTTQAEFIDVLQAIKDDGKYDAAGARFGRVAGSSPTTASTASGPAYWKGEEGRLGLIDGTKKLTDPEFVDGLRRLRGLEAVPAGRPGGDRRTPTWSSCSPSARPRSCPTARGTSTRSPDRPRCRRVRPARPEAGGQRYLQEMPDMAIGINAKREPGRRQDVPRLDRRRRSSSSCTSTRRPGFFAMSKQPVTYENALAQDFADLKDGAELTAASRPRPAERRHPAARRRDLAPAAGDVHDRRHRPPSKSPSELQDGPRRPGTRRRRVDRCRLQAAAEPAHRRAGRPPAPAMIEATTSSRVNTTWTAATGASSLFTLPALVVYLASRPARSQLRSS